MKLKNKLIPILSVATVATAAAPIISLTSCSKQEDIEMVDVTNGYIFRLEKSKADRQGLAQASADYYEAIKKNGEIFKQDYLAAMSKLIINALDGAMNQKIEIGLSSPKVGTTKSWGFGVDDAEFPTLSFKSKINICFDTMMTLPTEDEPSLCSIKLCLNLEYKNMIFTAHDHIQNSEGESPWCIGMINNESNDWAPTEQIIESLWPLTSTSTPWSIDFDWSYDISSKLDDKKSIEVVSLSDKQHCTSLASLVAWCQKWFGSSLNVEQIIWPLIIFEFRSTYLEDVKTAPELRLVKPLHGELILGLADTEIFGLKMAGYNSTEITNVKAVMDEKVVFKNASSTYGEHNVIIQKDQVLKEGVENNYSIPARLDNPFESVRSDAIAFTIEKKFFNVRISYEVDGQTYTYVQTVYIYHNDLALQKGLL